MEGQPNFQPEQKQLLFRCLCHMVQQGPDVPAESLGAIIDAMKLAGVRGPTEAFRKKAHDAARRNAKEGPGELSKMLAKSENADVVNAIKHFLSKAVGDRSTEQLTQRLSVLLSTTPQERTATDPSKVRSSSHVTTSPPLSSMWALGIVISIAAAILVWAWGPASVLSTFRSSQPGASASEVAATSGLAGNASPSPSRLAGNASPSLGSTQAEFKAKYGAAIAGSGITDARPKEGQKASVTKTYKINDNLSATVLSEDDTSASVEIDYEWHPSDGAMTMENRTMPEAVVQKLFDIHGGRSAWSRVPDEKVLVVLNPAMSVLPPDMLAFTYGTLLESKGFKIQRVWIKQGGAQAMESRSDKADLDLPPKRINELGPTTLTFVDEPGRKNLQDKEDNIKSESQKKRASEAINNL